VSSIDPNAKNAFVLQDQFINALVSAIDIKERARFIGQTTGKA
jgi:hypothetical protein